MHLQMDSGFLITIIEQTIGLINIVMDLDIGIYSWICLLFWLCKEDFLFLARCVINNIM